MAPHFYHHPGIFDDNFGPPHPWKPERLRRTHELLHRLTTVDLCISESAGIEDLTRVRSQEYVAAVEQVSAVDFSRLSCREEVVCPPPPPEFVCRRDGLGQSQVRPGTFAFSDCCV